jgi:hypothetical protein
MSLSVTNPYPSKALPWYKGNLHTHTNQSDGDRSPQDTVEAYASQGYDFLMLSDHDRFTDPADLDGEGMVLIPGNEVSAYGPHILHVNAHRCVMADPDRQGILDAIQADGGFAVVCHPNWMEDFNHCSQESLEHWDGYLGIEIYNAVCFWLPGSAVATDRWDRLLSQGRKVWGFANDDYHRDTGAGLAWNVVQAEKRNVGYIVKAMRQGQFYASTGVVLDSITMEEGEVRIQSSNAQSYRMITEHGCCLEEVEGSNLRFNVDDERIRQYLRIECFGQGSAMAWTQPFFVE